MIFNCNVWLPEGPGGCHLAGPRLRIVVALISIDSVSHGQANFHIVILSDKELERREPQQKP